MVYKSQEKPKLGQRLRKLLLKSLSRHLDYLQIQFKPVHKNFETAWKSSVKSLTVKVIIKTTFFLHLDKKNHPILRNANYFCLHMLRTCRI